MPRTKKGSQRRRFRYVKPRDVKDAFTGKWQKVRLPLTRDQVFASKTAAPPPADAA